MDDIEFITMKTSDVLSKYHISEEQYRNRYEALYNDIEQYIKASKFDEKQVFLNKYSLSCMLVDYFMDIGRLKEFHRIDHINSCIYFVLVPKKKTHTGFSLR